MSTAATLTVIINGVNNSSAALGEMSTQAATLGKSFGTLGASATALGKSMTTGITLPIVGIAAAGAKMAIDFQQSMTYVRTDAGDTEDNIDQLSQSVLNLAKTSQFSPDQLANGLYHLASLGLRGADAMNALNVAQEMASVGGADLESTSTALGAALVTGIKGVQDYSTAAGVLDATIGAGNMRMQDLVNALGTGVLPVFKNAGLSIQEFGASLATLTDNGQEASAAATHLRMTIALMEAPSQAAAKAMEDIGMTSNQLGMDMQTKGLVPALTDLRQHLLDTYGTTAAGKQQMAAALTEMFGGGRSSAAIQTLIDQIPRVQQKLQQITDQSGDFANKVAEQQQTAQAKIKTAWSSIQADAIQLGQEALPVLAQALTVIVADVTKLFDWYNNLSGSQKQLLNRFIAFMAVVGPSLLIFGKLVASVTLVTKTFGALGGVFKALSLTRFIGEAGTAATAVEGIGASSGGLLALLGPVGVGIGAVAVAAGVGYLAYKKWTDMGVEPTKKSLDEFNTTAEKVGVTITGTSSKVDILQLAQINAHDATTILNKALGENSQAYADNQKAQQELQKSYDAVSAAQDNVKKMHDQFGESSPQYQKAIDDLKSAQQDYDLKLQDTAKHSLNLVAAGGVLSDAEKIWHDSTYNLGLTQIDLNKYLEGGVGVIAKFGPTAGLQVGAIDVLQAHLSTVVTSWASLTANFGQQSADLNQGLQGLGSTLQRVQGQNDTLNASLSAATKSAGLLQNAGYNLQGSSISVQHHASGTDFAPGGWSVVGEEGPELINLPRGSQVLPAGKTQAIMNSASNSTTSNSKNITITNYNNFHNQTDPLAFARRQAFELQRR